MIGAWATQPRRMRVFLGVGALAGGFVVGAFLINHHVFSITTVIFALGLAAFVGAGKLASP